MAAIYVGLALLMITLVSLLVFTVERRALPPPPPPPPRRRQKDPKTTTNPFGNHGEPGGAMILSRRVLVNLPLPPPLPETELDLVNPFEDEVETLVSAQPQRPRVIEIEVDD